MEMNFLKKYYLIALLLFGFLIGCDQKKARLFVEPVDYLLVGESINLKITSSLKKDEFSFNSENPFIATIDGDGKVSGVSEGEVIIYIASKKGGYLEVVITIIEDYIPDEIKIDAPLDEYIVEGGTYNLTAVAYPFYTDQNFVWEVGGTKATINQDTGEIDFLEEGDVYVICRSKLDKTVYSTVKLTSVHQKDVEVIRLLFIGNSLTYVNDIPKMVMEMGKASGKVVYCDSFTPGGNTLEQIYTMSITSLEKLLIKNKYTYVILQESSYQNFRYQDSFLEYAMKLSDLVKSYDAQEVLLYQTWAYRENSVSLANLWLTREEMQNLIIEAYDRASAMLDADINPVGEIFYNFSLEYPEIDLYIDDNHASLAGSYLSSCVHFQSIFNQSVKGNPYKVGLDKAIVDLIQNYVASYFTR